MSSARQTVLSGTQRPPNSATGGSQGSSSSSEKGLEPLLTNLTNSIDRLVNRLDRQESRLTAIEEKLHRSSSSSSPDCQKKTKVPLAVRVSF